MATQLEFFDDNDKLVLLGLKHEVKVVQESSDKVRKSLFARHGELAGKYLELHERMEILEKYICLGRISM